MSQKDLKQILIFVELISKIVWKLVSAFLGVLHPTNFWRACNHIPIQLLGKTCKIEGTAWATLPCLPIVYGMVCDLVVLHSRALADPVGTVFGTIPYHSMVTGRSMYLQYFTITVIPLLRNETYSVDNLCFLDQDFLKYSMKSLRAFFVWVVGCLLRWNPQRKCPTYRDFSVDSLIV